MEREENGKVGTGKRMGFVQIINMDGVTTEEEIVLVVS